MKIIKVLTFSDENVAFATGNLGISYNKEEPVLVEEVEVSDELAKQIVDNPSSAGYNKITKTIYIK